MGRVAPIQGIRPGFPSGDSCQRVDYDVVSPSKYLSGVPQNRTGGRRHFDRRQEVLAVPVSLLRTRGMYVEKRGYFHLS